MTVCFTGHRQLPDADSAAFTRLVAALDAAIDDKIQSGSAHFITGGAAGFDTLAAERVLLRKKNNTAVSLTVYLPYRGFGSAFSAEYRQRAMRVLAACDRSVVVSEQKTVSCYARRNRRMVDDADAVIAFLREIQSGTGQTVRMAQQKGLSIVFLGEG